MSSDLLASRILRAAKAIVGDTLTTPELADLLAEHDGLDHLPRSELLALAGAVP